MLSTVRITNDNLEELVEQANLLLQNWQNYSNKKLNLNAYTGRIKHHTITAIARKVDNKYQLDLILHSNLTSKQHPLGIYHIHEDKWHFKKENIGLIEAIGLAILPGRLKEELEGVKQYILYNKELTSDNLKHKKWADQLKEKLNKRNILEFAKLLTKSHDSLKFDYEVTGIELDTIVELALKNGAIGAQMTGAGFGGCAIALVNKNDVKSFVNNVESGYLHKIGYSPSFYIVNISNGPKII